MNDCFIANFLENVTVKELRKSACIWRSYLGLLRVFGVGLRFRPTLYKADRNCKCRSPARTYLQEKASNSFARLLHCSYMTAYIAWAAKQRENVCNSEKKQKNWTFHFLLPHKIEKKYLCIKTHIYIKTNRFIEICKGNVAVKDINCKKITVFNHYKISTQPLNMRVGSVETPVLLFAVCRP